MALPILETASYELTLPSTDVVVNYRPFIVKDEKIFNELKNLLDKNFSKKIRSKKWK